MEIANSISPHHFGLFASGQSCMTKVDDLLIGEYIPDTVACQHNKLEVIVEFEDIHLRIRLRLEPFYTTYWIGFDSYS